MLSFFWVVMYMLGKVMLIRCKLRENWCTITFALKCTTAYQWTSMELNVLYIGVSTSYLLAFNILQLLFFKNTAWKHTAFEPYQISRVSKHHSYLSTMQLIVWRQFKMFSTNARVILLYVNLTTRIVVVILKYNSTWLASFLILKYHSFLLFCFSKYMCTLNKIIWLIQFIWSLR